MKLYTWKLLENSKFRIHYKKFKKYRNQEAGTYNVDTYMYLCLYL